MKNMLISPSKRISQRYQGVKDFHQRSELVDYKSAELNPGSVVFVPAAFDIWSHGSLRCVLVVLHGVTPQNTWKLQSLNDIRIYTIMILHCSDCSSTQTSFTRDHPKWWSLFNAMVKRTLRHGTAKKKHVKKVMVPMLALKSCENTTGSSKGVMFKKENHELRKP